MARLMCFASPFVSAQRMNGFLGYCSLKKLLILSHICFGSHKLFSLCSLDTNTSHRKIRVVELKLVCDTWCEIIPRDRRRILQWKLRRNSSQQCPKDPILTKTRVGPNETFLRKKVLTSFLNLDWILIMFQKIELTNLISITTISKGKNWYQVVLNSHS
jgi:hypothetical protein